jgi:hypothetical protein
MSAAEYIDSRNARGLHGRVSSRDLLEDYESWCADEEVPPLGRNALYAELRALGWTEHSNGANKGWLPPAPANDNAREVAPIRADADDVVIAYGRYEIPGQGWRGFAVPVSRRDVERLGDLAAPEILSVVVKRIERNLWRTGS